MIEGYKFFKEGFKSKFGDIQYEVGKTYTYDGEIELYKSGFHFSEKIEDAFLDHCYYAKHCCKVEGNGEVKKGKDKAVCSEIYIKEELNFNNVLRKLSNNKSFLVRSNVALNKNCPVSILRKLSEDKYAYIRSNVAYNENCPEDILRKLFKDKDWRVRANVAWNENCSEDILKKLSDDEDWHVREKVVENENCSEDILRKLSEDENYDVKNTAIEYLKEIK